MWNTLLWLLITLGTFTASLIALVVVATVPIASALAIAQFLAYFIMFTTFVASALELWFAGAIDNFNKCQARAAQPTVGNVAVIIIYTAALVAFLFGVGLGLRWEMTFGITRISPASA